MSITDTPPSSSAGIPNPNGIGGCPVVGCSTCKITSETKADVPKDRQRKKLGIGEKVKLTFSLGSAHWSFVEPSNVGLPPRDRPDEATPSDFAINIPGTNVWDWGELSKDSGDHIEYRAPASSPEREVTIAATGSGCTALISFEIIEPQYVTIKNTTDINNNRSTHEHSVQSTGFLGEVSVFPANVSFENCWYREIEACGIPYGDWRGIVLQNGKFRCIGHGPAKDARQIMRPKNDQSGSPGTGYDHISFRNPNALLTKDGNLPTGELHYEIRFEFSLSRDGQFHVPKHFTPAKQIVITKSNGFARIEKEGGAMENNIDDNTPEKNWSLDPSRDHRFG